MRMAEDSEVDHRPNYGPTCQKLSTKYGAKSLTSLYRGSEYYALLVNARTHTAVIQVQPSATATVKGMLITGLPAPEAIPAKATR
jgi:hypothetical protein